MEAVETLDAELAWVSDEERRRSERFRHAADAHAFLFRRAFLRGVLARASGAEPGALAFRSGSHGKPALLADGAPCFNLSRSRDVLVLALARGRQLGVDVEALDPRLAQPEELSRLAARVLTACEREQLTRTLPGERPRAFLRAWTRKEALLKAGGTGLSIEPATFAVGLDVRRTDQPRAWHGAPLSGAAVCLDLAAPSGFLAALTVCGAAPVRLVLHGTVRAPGLSRPCGAR